MAHELKFWYEFTSEEEESLNRVEILEDDYIGDPEEVHGEGSEPFIVEFPEFDTLASVRGSGATLSILIKSDIQLLRGFFTNDIKKFKVNHYIDGTLNWVGYLNSELYDEDFSIDTNEVYTKITLTANNGFGILERIKFINTDDSEVRDLMDVRDIMAKCINDLELGYVNLYLKLSTYIERTILYDVLDYTAVNTSNFIDEDREIASLREVLESVLEPFGAFIIAEGTDIYITDINLLAGSSSITFDRYLLSTMATPTPVVVDMEIDASETEIYLTGESIKYRTGINKQMVKVDPYPADEFLNCEINDINYVDGLTSSDNYGDSGYTWTEGSYTTHINYNFLTSRCIPKQIIPSGVLIDNSGGSKVVLAIDAENGGLGSPSDICVENIVNGPYLVMVGFTFLGIEGEFFVKTNTTKFGVSDSAYPVRFIELKLVIRWNDMYLSKGLNEVGGSWTITPSTYSWVLAPESPYQENVVTDAWIDFQDAHAVLANDSTVGLTKILLPYDVDVQHGDLKIGITPYVDSLSWSGTSFVSGGPNGTTIEEVWINRLRLVNVLSHGETVTTGSSAVEYTGYGDLKYKDEGSTASLTLGSLTQFNLLNRGCFIDTWGGFLGLDYTYLGWTINYITRGVNKDRLEYLLIATMMGNYRNPAPIYSATLKRTSYLKTIVNLPTFEDGERFMFKGGRINFYNNSMEASWIAIKEDETI